MGSLWETGWMDRIMGWDVGWDAEIDSFIKFLSHRIDHVLIECIYIWSMQGAMMGERYSSK